MHPKPRLSPMRRTSMISWFAIALSVGGFWLAAHEARAAEVVSVHSGVHPGEAMTFKFSVGAIESGRARVAVGKPGMQNGKRVLPMQAEAESAPWLSLFARLKDSYVLYVDTATLLPLSVSTVETGIRERKIDASISGTRIDLHAVDAKGNKSKRSHVIPEVARDPMSAFFALRAAPLEDGDLMKMWVLDSQALLKAEFTVHRGEEVRLGEDGSHPEARRAIRIECTTIGVDALGRSLGRPPRHLSMWLSDDAERVMLKLIADTDLGKSTVELTSYQPGNARAKAPSLPGVEVQRRGAFKAIGPRPVALGTVRLQPVEPFKP